VRLYARIGQALLTAKEAGADPFAAIEKIVSWVDFARTVSEAEQLAQPEDFDFLGLISNGFPQMRRYTPAMLDIFEFRAAPAARPLLEVVDILRAMNRDKSRSVPQNAPLEWMNQRWRPYVLTDEGIDRRFYELCALTELKNRLRSGDIWVTGSRQFKDFEAYLLEPSRFTELRAKQTLSLPVEQDGDSYLTARIATSKSWQSFSTRNRARSKNSCEANWRRAEPRNCRMNCWRQEFHFSRLVILTECEPAWILNEAASRSLQRLTSAVTRVTTRI
jgi:hypothetical protein